MYNYLEYIYNAAVLLCQVVQCFNLPLFMYYSFFYFYSLAMEHLMASDRSKAPTSLKKGSVRERSVSNMDKTNITK
jgi:hypothetical protein